jgi:hypothetical protein
MKFICSAVVKNEQQMILNLTVHMKSEDIKGETKSDNGNICWFYLFGVFKKIKLKVE